jgi:DNA (cytosine-5)-methyltransferase 1
MKTFGSVCSGIEASQLAFSSFGFEQLWSSEIADFPSKVLKHHYSSIPNVGDMVNIPQLILDKKIDAPDLFCGGTPCQAFSLAGWKNGLEDKRGQLTITFIEIANAIDKIRKSQKKEKTIVLWENVEGVLNDKTNAFGNFIAGLAGFDEEIKVKKWSKSGYLEGPTRNVAWRVLDAKYFGLSQQRKRLYVIAGDKNFHPDQIIFELNNVNHLKKQNCNKSKIDLNQFNLFPQKRETKKSNNIFYKNGSKFQVFREYTDCLYAAYGTKWNGNAAAYNGSLYITQNDRLRRLTPLECERLMGIPDNYTLIKGSSDTNRYQAIGNSWAVPVIKWIGKNINNYNENFDSAKSIIWKGKVHYHKNNLGAKLFLFENVIQISESIFLNTTTIPNNLEEGNIQNIIQTKDISEKLYLSPKACKGILRRRDERNMKMNIELEKIMEDISLDVSEFSENIA